ncbi:MAG TPA: holo-ACP synthase [Methanocorpusculum sp.]|nr:holo-ACP synthase [Methanocorpusculum sp.]HJJ40213.1 holo-ACP synthase [Methanocorpusculum sp.]HJJ49602.1 holo-ACP synthase [Methanocorpusculum sp.]HJJ57687.1 holo-ACP synthase [Methanocorpusculum sp.]HJJ95767.1 holo-ACP synthase [Methanocorpusculum sp.]
MRIYTGCDIIQISRFEGQLEKQKFLDRCFTAAEQEYCFSTSRPAEHFAARFAAKEAVIKALLCVQPDFHDMKKLEIQRMEDGRPSVVLFTDDERLNLAKIEVSISHDGDYAMAVSIAYFD